MSSEKIGCPTAPEIGPTSTSARTDELSYRTLMADLQTWMQRTMSEINGNPPGEDTKTVEELTVSTELESGHRPVSKELQGKMGALRQKLTDQLDGIERVPPPPSPIEGCTSLGRPPWQIPGCTSLD